MLLAPYSATENFPSAFLPYANPRLLLMRPFRPTAFPSPTPPSRRGDLPPAWVQAHPRCLDTGAPLPDVYGDNMKEDDIWVY